MNLHNIHTPLKNVALWLSVWGANGRFIGTHLWPIEEGTPPEGPETMHRYSTQRYWSPQRFGWQAFSPYNLMRNGYVEPLCGQRSQSRRPRIAEVGEWAIRNATPPCASCARIAVERGMLPLIQSQAMQQSPVMLELQAERLAFIEAGRPTTWPIES